MEDYPETLQQFESRFSTEEGCRGVPVSVEVARGISVPAGGRAMRNWGDTIARWRRSEEGARKPRNCCPGCIWSPRYGSGGWPVHTKVQCHISICRTTSTNSRFASIAGHPRAADPRGEG